MPENLLRTRRELGTRMKRFDVETTLADLNSRETSLLDCSIIVVGSAADFLEDLYGTFVSLN